MILYIPKIDDYLEILTDKEVKDFVDINFSEYCKYIREEQNLKKAAKSFYIFLTLSDEVENYVHLNCSDNSAHHRNVEILNLFDPELQMINTKKIKRIVKCVEKV